MEETRGLTTNELAEMGTSAEFLKEFGDSLTAARESDTPVSLALLDIDGFYGLEDKHGKAIGVEIVKAGASHLEGFFAGRGKVYPVGDDDFAVVMPETDKESAFLVTEAARQGFDADNERTFEADGRSVTLAITFSGGVATFPDDGARIQDVSRKADDALYRAKETGRNKVCLSREEKMVTKTSHYTQAQLERLSRLAKREGVSEAVVLREALDDVLRKYTGWG